MSHNVTMAEHQTLFIGLMSGTSLDGVDGVLCAMDASGKPTVLAHQYRAFDGRTRALAMQLNTPGLNELHLSSQLGIQLAHDYAAVCAALCDATGIAASNITAIGAHGQTVRHQPQAATNITGLRSVGYTVQVNQPALLAELTAIDVIADFRSRDIAAGGQGAPLVPAFHHAVFGDPTASVAVLNVGGIANISLLSADGRVAGCDTGPGNVLLDLWVQQHLHQPYDEDGQWGAGGKVLPDLLDHLLQDAFFQHQQTDRPRSTGRDHFNLAWLNAQLAPFEGVKPVDVQATLTMLTARSAASQLSALHAQSASNSPIARLLVCGGGAHNQCLMESLKTCLPNTPVETTGALGLPVLQVEAAAFAWLAWCFTQRHPANAIAATGASGPRILGALYPK